MLKKNLENVESQFLEQEMLTCFHALICMVFLKKIVAYYTFFYKNKFIGRWGSSVQNLKKILRKSRRSISKI